VRQLKRALPIVIAGALVLGACGGDDADTAGSTAAPATTGAAPDDTPGADPTSTTGAADGSADLTEDRCTAERAGGSLTVGVFSLTKGLDPVVSTGSGTTGGTEIAAIYDTLMRWNAETGEYEPRLAESLVPDDGFGAWTLTLRPDVTFGNGDPYTTAAVAASIERHKDPEAGSVSRVFAELIASTEIIDDRTMVFQLAKPWSEFPYVLADELGMVPNPAVIEALGPDAFNLAPAGAGAGPFEFVSFAPGESVVLRAKDDYWGGPVCIEELTFASSGTPGAAFDSLDTGQFDVGVFGDIDLITQLREQGVAMHSEAFGGVGLLINNGVRGTTPPTTDVRLRRAVSLALDTEALDERINEGQGVPTSALFGPQSIYAGAAGPAADPAAATALIEEVKAEGTWDGKIRFACQNDVYSDQRVAVAAALRAVGFDVQEETVGTTAQQVQKVIVDADYDLACWSLQLFDNATWVTLDRSLRSDSSATRIGYASAEMDAALDQLRTAADVEARRAAIAEIQEIWNETVPSAVIRASEYVVASADDVHGLVFDHEVITYFDQAYIGSE
jgi:peptide/nickel transport system substrate-binding protein